MKKIILISLLMVTMATSYAQFSGGIKGGMNFAKLESSFVTTDSESGFYGGIFGTYALSPSFALQTEVLYTRQAGETNGFEYDFDLLAVPLMLRYSWKGVRVYAGGHLAFLLSINASILETDDFSKTAGSAVAGAGYEFPFKVEVGGRYVHGLSDISDNEFIQDVHFRMWEIYAAWRLFGK